MLILCVQTSILSSALCIIGLSDRSCPLKTSHCCFLLSPFSLLKISLSWWVCWLFSILAESGNNGEPLCLTIIGTWEATSETTLNASKTWSCWSPCGWVCDQNKQGKSQLKRGVLLTWTWEKNKNCLELFVKNISGRIKWTSKWLFPWSENKHSVNKQPERERELQTPNSIETWA